MIDVVGPVVKVETQARLEGRNMSMVLAPDRRALEDQAKAASEAEQATVSGRGGHRWAVDEPPPTEQAEATRPPAPSSPTSSVDRGLHPRDPPTRAC